MQKYPLVELFLQSLKQSGTASLITWGSSMGYIIKNGDKVDFMRIDDLSNLKFGDILLIIDKNNRILVHRLIGRKKNLIYLKGDSQLQKETFNSGEIAIASVSRVSKKNINLQLNGFPWLLMRFSDGIYSRFQAETYGRLNFINLIIAYNTKSARSNALNIISKNIGRLIRLPYFINYIIFYSFDKMRTIWKRQCIDRF